MTSSHSSAAPFIWGRRHLEVARSHFGDDILFARSGECVAAGHFSQLAESAGNLRIELSGVEEFEHTVPVPFEVAVPLGEVSSGDFAHILEAGLSSQLGLEDPRIPYDAQPKTAEEIAVIAVYDARCAITGYQASTQAQALGRLDVVFLWPLSQGGRAEISNAIPVDAAVAYAVRHGNITFSDDYEIEIRIPLPVLPPYRLRQRLGLPTRAEHWPSLESIRFHRALHQTH